jgi:serine/threonine protein phosphatase PrpC
VNFVSETLKKKRGKDSVCAVVEDLLDSIVATDVASSNGIGTDNMTCIVVEFKK